MLSNRKRFNKRLEGMSEVCPTDLLDYRSVFAGNNANLGFIKKKF